ncbi:unnamed protein product, partial [Rangifer tarandus platyrhynchus]
MSSLAVLVSSLGTKEPRKVEGKYFLPDTSYIASAFIICSFVLLMTLSSTYIRMQVITQNNS